MLDYIQLQLTGMDWDELRLIVTGKTLVLKRGAGGGVHKLS